MKPVKTQPRFKCDFCKKRSTKTAMERHERRCFRNPDRYCDFCENQGFTWETVLENYPDAKMDCPYCGRRDEAKTKAINEYYLKV